MRAKAESIAGKMLRQPGAELSTMLVSVSSLLAAGPDGSLAAEAPRAGFENRQAAARMAEALGDRLDLEALNTNLFPNESGGPLGFLDLDSEQSAALQLLRGEAARAAREQRRLRRQEEQTGALARASGVSASRDSQQIANADFALRTQGALGSFLEGQQRIAEQESNRARGEFDAWAAADRQRFQEQHKEQNQKLEQAAALHAELKARQREEGAAAPQSPDGERNECIRPHAPEQAPAPVDALVRPGSNRPQPLMVAAVAAKTTPAKPRARSVGKTAGTARAAAPKPPAFGRAAASPAAPKVTSSSPKKEILKNRTVENRVMYGLGFASGLPASVGLSVSKGPASVGVSAPTDAISDSSPDFDWGARNAGIVVGKYVKKAFCPQPADTPYIAPYYAVPSKVSPNSREGILSRIKNRLCLEKADKQADRQWKQSENTYVNRARQQLREQEALDREAKRVLRESQRRKGVK